MIVWSSSIDIQRPPEIVFDFLANIQDVQQSDDSPMLALDLITEAPPRLGSKYREVVQMMPLLRGEIISEITAFDPHRVLEMAWRGPGMTGTDRYELAITQDGTTLNHTKCVSCSGVLHVINPSYEKIDWDDLESIKNHKTETAYERTKMMHRVIAGELARRYAGRISSVAFDPSKSIKQIPVMFIIDKNDPELEKRWPTGFMGFWWKVLTLLIAKPPAVAGEPIADLMLSYEDRSAINGALFQLDKRVEKPDKAMNDEEMGHKLWDELMLLTGLTPAGEKEQANNSL